MTFYAWVIALVVFPELFGTFPLHFNLDAVISYVVAGQLQLTGVFYVDSYAAFFDDVVFDMAGGLTNRQNA